MKRLAIVILCVFLLAGCESEMERRNREMREVIASMSLALEVDRQMQSILDEISPTETRDPNTIYSGQYKVGTDIDAKLYLLVAEDSGGYFKVSTDSNGNDIVFNDNFEEFSYVKVEDGEYFKISGAIAVDGNKKSPIINSIVGISEGMYIAGRDIPAGEYKLRGVRSDGEGYYKIIDSRHEIYDNDYFDGTAYVTVKKGQFLYLAGAEIVSAP